MILCSAALTTSRPLASSDENPAAGAADAPALVTTHVDPVVQRALAILGRPVNPITVVTDSQVREIYSRTAGAGVPPPGLNGFRVREDPQIYLNSDSEIFTAARRGSAFALLRLAATILHEQVHETQSEYGAYRAQVEFVRSRSSLVPRRDAGRLREYQRLLETRATAFWLVQGRPQAPDPDGKLAVAEARPQRESTR